MFYLAPVSGRHVLMAARITRTLSTYNMQFRLWQLFILTAAIAVAMVVWDQASRETAEILITQKDELLDRDDCVVWLEATEMRSGRIYHFEAFAQKTFNAFLKHDLALKIEDARPIRVRYRAFQFLHLKPTSLEDLLQQHFEQCNICYIFDPKTEIETIINLEPHY